MINRNKSDIDLEQVIAEINGVLEEIKNEQTIGRKTMEQNHKVIMQKFSKIIEYNKINDMTNQIFEKRISNIEKLLYEVFKS